MTRKNQAKKPHKLSFFRNYYFLSANTFNKLPPEEEKKKWERIEIYAQRAEKGEPIFGEGKGENEKDRKSRLICLEKRKKLFKKTK